MSFDFDSNNPVTYEAVLSQFGGCNDLNAVKRKARELVNVYYPENWKGTFPCTREQGIQICEMVNRLLMEFENNAIDYSVLSEAPQKEYIDYSEYRRQLFCSKWDELWNFDLDYGQNLLELFPRFIVLPDMAIQLPILASICCFNTAINNIAFNVEVYSRKPGSGKSTISEIISGLQGILRVEDSDGDGLGQAGTFAGDRNYIQYNRLQRRPNGDVVRDSNTNKAIEKNVFLMLDDFPKTHLKNPDYYTLLKAYKRNSAYIRKAERIKNDDTGEWEDITVSHPVFCVKMLSACYSLFSEQQYSELTRRTFFIKCMPIQDLINCGYIEEIPTDLLRPSEINWRGAYQLYENAWDREASAHYQRAYKALKRPRTVPTEKWEITQGVLASGLTLGVFSTIAEATDACKDYWAWFAEQIEDARSPVENLLQRTIIDWQELCEDPLKNREYFINGTKNPYYPLEKDKIHPGYIDKCLKIAWKDAELDTRPSDKVRTEAMKSLGYKLKRFDGKAYYVEID